MNPIITANIFSKLGNSSSLLPIAVKDAAHSAGMTTSAYITGNEVEGKDRFIDEFGTQVIWIGGIPFFKKVIDWSVYKLAKYNPDIDIRLLKNKEILEKAIEKAPTEAIAKSIKKAAENTQFFKGLAMTKFIAATALTLASYWGLTNFRHKHTEQNVIKEIKKEENEKKLKEDAFKSKMPVAFKAFGEQNNKHLSFKGLNPEAIKDFMFDPVKNMMIVDGGITAERFSKSRNPQDVMGYAIKEGGFWAFMYFVGPIIQKALEKKAAQNNKPIDLDIRILQDETFKKAFIDKLIPEQLDKFSTAGTDAEIYEQLFKDDGNFIVKMAKKAQIIKTIIVDNVEKIDTQHYIDIDAVKGIKSKMTALYNQAQKETNIKKFLEEIIKTKQMSILTNIGASIGALGLLIPAIIVAMRFMDKDNKEFQVKKEIHEKLKKESNIA